MLNIPYEEFWIYPIGLFEDMIAARQIMDGADEISTKEVNYNDGSMWGLN